MSFEDLGLSPETLKAIAERGYTTPTPIQAEAIPQVLMMRDVLGLAQTGTGKTAGFTLPMIEILQGGRARARMPRSLILEPTRELAAQVAENFDVYGKYHKLTKALLVGGESMADQQKILDRGVDVLIATPGRLLDLFERGHILLNDIKVLVIDEADRMLDMGFIPDIEKIVSRVPPLRQTLLFSATMPKEIEKLADKFLSNPKRVSVAPPASPAETVYQGLIWTGPRQKREALDALIQQENVKNAFIFCNRKKDIADLTKWLSNHNYAVGCLHGDMVQSARYDMLDRFKDGEISLMVCSDVAARGLDIAGVSHVFNYDVPMSADDYVHRIGRTGRAGQQGRAFSIATPADDKYVKAIERLIKKNIPVTELENLSVSGGGGGDAGESGDDDKRGRNNRRGGRGRGRGGKKDHNKDNQPQQQSKPQQDKPKQDKPKQDKPRNDSRTGGNNKGDERKQRRYRDDDTGGPDSFGEDNMPAFLRR